LKEQEDARKKEIRIAKARELAKANYKELPEKTEDDDS